MQIHDTELPRGHGESIGHGHDWDFLQAEDVSKAAIANKGVVERHFGCAGIAEDMPHAEAGEEIEEGVDSADGHAGDCSRIRRVRGGGKSTGRKLWQGVLLAFSVSLC